MTTGGRETNPTVLQLPAVWRERAELLREHGAEQAARTAAMLARELDEALRLGEDEPLTLEEASRESGLSVDHLGRLVRQGKIANAGRPGAPRIRRAALPRRVAGLPGGAPHCTVAQVRADLARSVATQS